MFRKNGVLRAQGRAGAACVRFKRLSETVEGRCGGGIACQDALEHIHVSLILDILSQKVLAGNPPTTASAST